MIRWLWLLGDKLRHRARLRRETSTFAAGRRGEDLAHRYLQRKGYRVVARNFRTRTGSAEVDIVACKEDAVVFFEVKLRETDEYGSPGRAIDFIKQQHIMKAASEYLKRADIKPERARFDIINIVLDPVASELQKPRGVVRLRIRSPLFRSKPKPAIEHLEDAFYFPRTV
jgi:putative endonuclease